MKIVKRIIFLSLILTFLPPLFGILYAQGQAREKIIYLVSPLGMAEYTDLGSVELDGNKARLITFKTQVLWFNDTEKIYAVPDTLLPLRIERDVSSWFGKEYIIEEYDQKNFTLTITKYQENKVVSRTIVKTDAPIQNAILLAFYPRLNPRLDIGWTFQVRLPAKFEVKLVSIDEITVPLRKFRAYHFISNPDKFELWVNAEEPHIPIKIKGKGGLGYALVMKEYDSLTGN